MSTQEVPAPGRTSGPVGGPGARGPGVAPAPASSGVRSPAAGNGGGSPPKGQRSSGKAGPSGPPQTARRAVRPPGSPRRKTIVYDDQARRPGRRGPAPPAVEVRRVRRVLRRVDTWSLFRFSILLYACGLLVFLVAAVGLWLLASSAGAIPSIENFITQLFALKKFHFKGPQLLVGTVAVGVVGVLASTLFTVVAGVLYNLISDVVGGIELTVLEEEPLEIIG